MQLIKLDNIRYSFSLKNLLKSVYPFITALQSIKSYRFHPRISISRLRYVSFVISAVIFLCLSSFLYIYIFQDLPSPHSLTSVPIPLTTHIRDRNGIELYKVYHNQNRTLIKLADLPPAVKQAVISIEDKDFYHHSGFSLTGTLRAAYRILNNDRLEGGSTITQQLVKTSLLSPERTFQRKIRELVLAVMVERMYTKDQILEMYLNRVSFGGSAYGIEEAAQMYFGKSARDLDLAQASLLAGLPASPTTYSPYGNHPDLAKNRQKDVLRQMVAGGFITWDQAQAASAQELKFNLPQVEIKAPHFVMYIKDLLAKKYGPDVLEQGGLDVTTSLDLKLQDKVQQLVSSEVAKINYLHVTNGAAMVTNPQTGEILAMVGSKDYFDTSVDGNVNVALAMRQPGSSIKPVNYALAFTKGFTPASFIDDSPVTYKTPGQENYSPINYDNRFHGRVTLRSALANSYNVPAVKLLSANGVSNMIDLGKQLGISTWNDPDRFGLSLTLGGGEVTMADMSVVYGTFANQGLRVDLHPILSVRDSRDRLLEEYRCGQDIGSSNQSPLKAQALNFSSIAATTCPNIRVLDPMVAYLISDILSDNTARTPIFGPRSDLYIPGSQVAVKTGTTNSLRDNWTIGYTPDRLVAVWVGNNDNTPMSYVASGITGASPIWRGIMDDILKSHPSIGFALPSQLVKVNICPITGQLACAACGGMSEYFIPGTQPKDACNDDAIRKYKEDKDQANRDQILNGASTQFTPPVQIELPSFRKPPKWR